MSDLIGKRLKIVFDAQREAAMTLIGTVTAADDRFIILFTSEQKSEHIPVSRIIRMEEMK